MSLQGSPRYLIIRRDNIGDLLCTTPFIAALRIHHPRAYIGALVNSYNREVLSGNPDIDEIFAYTKVKHRGPNQSLLGVLAGRLQMFRDIRRAAVDLAILAAPGFQPRSLRLARMAGAKRVLGFVDRAGEGGVELGVPSAGPQGLHEVEEVFRLATALGINDSPPSMKIVPDPQRQRDLERRIATHCGSRRGPLIAVHISARKPSQRWPGERFAVLLKHLSNSFDARLLLLWSPGAASNTLHPGDDEKAQAVAKALDGASVLASPTPQLGDLIAAVAACDLMICADGGAMHIAAALAKPTVCLFGDSTASRWHPWKTRFELLQPESRNVGDISVEQVFSAVGRCLGTILGEH
jgi:heptosyltransferase-3